MNTDDLNQNITQIQNIQNNKKYTDFKNMIQNNVQTLDLKTWQLNSKLEVDQQHAIGAGAFGSVYSGKYKNNNVAVKIIQNLIDDKFLKEINLQLKAGECCFGVAKIIAFSSSVTPFFNQPCIVMELAVCSLYDALYNPKFQNCVDLSKASKFKYAFEISSALKIIHEVGIIHRDLKSVNILFFHANNNVNHHEIMTAKICDFGLAKSNDIKSTIISMDAKGTPYMAPEIFNAVDSASKYTEQSDVYAFGILLNELMTEMKPYSMTIGTDPSFHEVFAKVMNNERPSLYSDISIIAEIDDIIRLIIQLCWQVDASRRLLFSAISGYLQDLFDVESSNAMCGSVNLNMSKINKLKNSKMMLNAIYENVSGKHQKALQLKDLNVKQLAKLMESMEETDLRDLFSSKVINGAMLSYCESVEDLMHKDVGVQSKLKAKFLLNKIQTWMKDGVHID
jgi:serine/threonine protein kinase